MLTVALGTTEITQKHTPLIVKHETLGKDDAFFTHKMAS